MKKEILIREFIQKVWNEKDFDSITNYVAAACKIYKDPSDPSEGKTLNFEEFAMRLDYTHDSFPDIHFEIENAISKGDNIAVTWIMTATNSGNIRNFSPTGKSINATENDLLLQQGQSIGALQGFDRATIMNQLEFIK